MPATASKVSPWGLPLGGALALLCGCLPPTPSDAALDSDPSDTSSDRGNLPSCGATVTPLPATGCPVLGCDESEGGASLQIGYGRDGSFEGFSPWSEHDTVYLTPGEQGLQHLLVGLRGSGFDARLPFVEMRAVRASDCVEVGYLRVRFPFSTAPENPALLALPGLRLTLSNDTDRTQYCTVLGSELRVVVVLDDNMGHRVRRERTLHLAGIDPAARADLQLAWLQACLRRDGGLPDGFPSLPEASLTDATFDTSLDGR